MACGAGGDYTLDKVEFLSGTKTTVIIKGDESDRIEMEFRAFASYLQWDGKLTLNSEVLPTNLKKGSKRRELSWGTIYTNNSFPGTIICRIHGIPMFRKPTRFKGTVLRHPRMNSTDSLQI